MNIMNEKIDKAIKIVVSAVANAENGDWPPVCSMFLFQPERPKLEKEEKN